jgi:putative ATP-dependent endonuclease of OLD family
MKIEKITLRNFRCFGPQPTEILAQTAVTALVGGNGSGKTALLIALSRLFGVTTGQRSVRKTDFHLRPDEAGLLSGATLVIEVVISFPELADADGNDAPGIPDSFLHMSASAPGEPLKARMRLQAVWTDDGTPDGTVEEDIRWIAVLNDDFKWEDCQKVSPVERASIQLVYVPATRNVADQVTNLLKGRLWRAAQWSDDLADAAETGADDIQQQFEAEKPTQFITDRLKRRWRQVYEADTDTTPVLRLVESRLEDLVRRAEFAFFPDEAEQVRRLDDLSDGQRSLFHIALTAATLEIERDALALAPGESVFDQEKLRRAHLTLLAIEEPENSLSPFFLSRIMTQVREIGQLPSAQVFISSHSASILSRVEPEEVRYFRFDRKVRQSSVRSIVLPTDDADAHQYVRLAVRAYPELYFARFVILGEGDSERIVLPRIAEAMGVPLDPSFVPIVPLGGRYVSHFWRLLNDLRIPHATLLDFDFGRQHGGANAIRSVVAALREIGNDLSENSYVISSLINLDELESLTDTDLLDAFEDNKWLQALAEDGVFFSDPIDLDFSMLCSFSAAYRHPHPGGKGPRTDAESVQEKKRVTLKTGGNPSLYEDSFDDQFAWYPYLFLSHSKPETHLSALGRITTASLAGDAPPEIKALIKRLKEELGIEDGDE